MPDQATYDKAVAVAQLVLTRIKPLHDGYLNHNEFSTPPPLAAGLTTPLPASLTGDTRNLNLSMLRSQAQDAWDALEVVCETQWALGAE